MSISMHTRPSSPRPKPPLPLLYLPSRPRFLSIHSLSKNTHLHWSIEESNMASEQQQRRRVDETFQRENTNSDRDVHVEKGKAHKMTSHFESLADKSKDSGTGGIGLGEGQAGGGGRDTLVGRVAVVEVGVPAEKREVKIGDQGGRTEAKSATEVGAGTHGTTRGVGPEKLHQISGGEQKRGGGGMIGAGKGGGTKGAATATGGGEMHGADTVGVGEGKVHHRTEAQISHGQGEKQQQSKGHDTAEKRGGQGQESQLSLEEIAKLRALAQQNSMDSLREMDERYKKATEAAGAASEFAAQKASQAKNTVTQGAQTATQYVTEKAVSAKDTAMEKTQRGYQAAKEYTVPKAAQAKDYTAQKAVETKDYTAQKALEAKNKAAEVTKNMAGYAGEKAVVAKDTAVEKSKVASDYTGKVASDVKDKAVVAGWGAAHYTTEKTVEGTKMVARAVEGVAGKVGEVVAGAGHVAADLAKKSLSAVKDTAISTEETVAEYTARKREEAERQLKAKNPDTEESRGLTQGTTGIGAGDTIGTAKAAAGAIGDILGGPPEQENLFSPATELVHEGAKLASDTVQGTAAAARDTVGGIFQRKQGGGVVQSGTQAAEDTARAATDTALGTARVAKDTVKGTAAAAATGPLGGVYQELKSGAQAAKDTVGTAGAATETVKSAVSATGAAMDTVSEKILGSEQQGGVLGAIGETIVEIAQTTKNIVVGPAEIQTEANTEYNDVTDSIKKTEVTRQRLQKRQ